MWETLTVPRLKALEDHWAEEPPVGLLVANFMGYKPKKKKQSKKAKREGVKKLLQMFPKGTISG